MIRPIEFAQTRPSELPGGYSTTNTEIWQMFSACREGDLDAVRELVERCPGLVHSDYNYTPPIHFAVREGHAPVVRYLLDRGADPNLAQERLPARPRAVDRCPARQYRAGPAAFGPRRRSGGFG